VVAKEKRGEKRSGVCYARAIYARRDAARHRAAMCARVMRMHHDAARGTEAENAENTEKNEKKESVRGRVNERFSEIVVR